MGLEKREEHEIGNELLVFSINLLALLKLYFLTITLIEKQAHKKKQ